MLTAVRKEKALAKVSLKTAVDSITVRDTQDRLRLLRQTDGRPAGGGQHPARSIRPRPTRSRSRRCSLRPPSRRRMPGLSLPMDYAAALSALEARKETRMVPDLSRILALATYLDDPQLTYPTIHVTGTNGKATAARVATAIACAHGLTTGLYTSPHLESRDRAILGLRRRRHREGVRRGVHAPAAVPGARRRPVRGAGHLLRGADGPRVPVVRRQAGRRSASSRSVWAARGTPRTSSRATSR